MVHQLWFAAAQGSWQWQESGHVARWGVSPCAASTCFCYCCRCSPTVAAGCSREGVKGCAMMVVVAAMAVAWVNCWRSPAPSSTNAPGTWHAAAAGSAGAASRCQSPCYTPPFAPPSFALIPSRKKIGKEKRKEPSGVARREPFPRFPSKQRQPSLLRGFT